MHIRVLTSNLVSILYYILLVRIQRYQLRELSTYKLVLCISYSLVIILIIILQIVCIFMHSTSYHTTSSYCSCRYSRVELEYEQILQLCVAQIQYAYGILRLGVCAAAPVPLRVRTCTHSPAEDPSRQPLLPCHIGSNQSQNIRTSTYFFSLRITEEASSVREYSQLPSKGGEFCHQNLCSGAYPRSRITAKAVR